MSTIDKLRKWLIAPFLQDAIQDDVTQACITAQQRYCDDNELPHYAPYDGICWHCGRNIYDGGITVDEAAGRLITACPFCHTTFCD